MLTELHSSVRGMLTSSYACSVSREEASGLWSFSTGGIPAGNRADRFLVNRRVSNGDFFFNTIIL